MSSKGGKSRSRKPLETSLGQAPRPEPQIDASSLQKPINTSVFGLKQVLQLFQTATNEVQNYIQFECDVLYECRMCRSIFRSLANFILHKRNYCPDKYVGSETPQNGADPLPVVIEETTERDDDKKKAKAIDPIIERLLKNQAVAEQAKALLHEDLSDAVSPHKQDGGADDDVVFIGEEKKTILLQKIDSNPSAVFQTVSSKDGGNSMKSEVMEIHGIFDNNEVVLGRDGKVCNFTKPAQQNGGGERVPSPPPPTIEFRCIECKTRFATQKTLNHHIKIKHNKTCIVYPCPDCRETFANAWSVYRHLYKVHRRTAAHVRRMRAQIHAGAIPKHQTSVEPTAPTPKTPLCEENQWMEDLESTGLQMCGGCGKRFERKAALHSHSQMCTKRAAVRSTIGKERLKEELKLVATEPKMGLKGAAKRKPYIYVRKPAEIEVTLVDDAAAFCDEKEVSLKPGVDFGASGDKDPLNLSDEVTITKENGSEVAVARDVQPIVEIFTISDDDDSSNGSSKRRRGNAPEDGDDVELYARAQPYIDAHEMRCFPCAKTYATPYQLLWHMSLHFNWVKFQCSKCAFQSFNKEACARHAHKTHRIPMRLVEVTVLPIPRWKMEGMAHAWRDLEGNEAAERAEAMIREGEVANDDATSSEKEEDDDKGEEKIVEDVIKMGEEKEGVAVDEGVEFTPPKDKCGGGSQGRPVRNRTKSFKTVQNDFIYDLAKVLKLNADNLSRRVRKTSSKKE